MSRPMFSPLFSRVRPLLRGRSGVALVIVLAFVVLLTGLVVAFFSRAMSERQVSNSSASQTKVDIFAQGAVETILGDFKQEIQDGSLSQPTSGGPTIFFPRSPRNASPTRTGTISGADLPPNLLKRSAANAPFSVAYQANTNSVLVSGTVRAAAVSTASASLNGRSISLDRWNKALLLPKAAPATTSVTPATSGAVSLTPSSSIRWSFAAPDWILVARGDSNPTTWSNNLKTSQGNLTSVVGRYAYCIYNEGGLLDLNVAGYPSAAGSGAAILAGKGVPAFADLTRLPTSSGTLSATTVDNIIAWRNAATASTGGAGYLAAMRSNTTGFLTVSSTLGITDRAFVTRQELIKALTSGTLGLSLVDGQNLLQYFGTFSRALEQPSYWPNPSRPLITAAALDGSGLGNFVGSYGSTYRGGNDEYRNDNKINPAFLSVRVQTPFTRYDGSTAVVGEPLVKTRFPLSRIDKLQTGTAAEILQLFGLQLQTGTSSLRNAWSYAQYRNDGASMGGILTLSEVSALGREPNFVELLKAALCAGSLGKAAPDGGAAGQAAQNYAYTLDKSLDLQVMQIAANVIDQWDADDYPTLIDFLVHTDSSGTPAPRQVRGMENLPYLYRIRFASATVALPTTASGTLPLTDGATTRQVPVAWYANVSGNPSYPTLTGTAHAYRSMIAPTGTLVGSGSSALCLVPEIWNPGDAHNAPGASRPAKFRAVALTQDPQATGPTWQISAQANASSDAGTPNPYNQTPTPYTLYLNLNPIIPASLYYSWTADNTALEFTDPTAAFFHEPTMLWRPDVPTGSGLAAGAGHLIRSLLSGSAAIPYVLNPSMQMLGWCAGIIPLAMSTPTDGTHEGIIQADWLFIKNKFLAGSPATVSPAITCRLQYQDPNGRWITYDEKYSSFYGLPGAYEPAGTVPDPTKPGSNGMFGGYLSATTFGGYKGEYGSLGVVDPRSNRFSMVAGGGGSPHSPSILDLDASGFYSVTENTRPDGGLGGCHRWWVPGQSGNDTTLFGFYPQTGTDYWRMSLRTNYWTGLLAQNNPLVKVPQATNTSVPVPAYIDPVTSPSEWGNFMYEDPDGVVRRAMAAYAPVPTVTGTLAASGTDGLPMATATNFGGSGNGIGTTTPQSQSRSLVLNRPFHGVSEMSYAFRGTPWKNIDFMTPESGDAALLDVFCINEPPSNGLVAGKVDLNTRQAPVLKALLANAYRNEVGTTGAGYCDPGLSDSEADAIAKRFVARTVDTAIWRGPLGNLGEIVGRYVGSSLTVPASAKDVYTYTVPTATANGRGGNSWTYAGFSAALGDTGLNGEAETLWDPANSKSAFIQRYREAAIRPLVNCGQVRVWNLLIDVIAQTGRYPASAGNLSQFLVEGEKHYWVHVAIDRATGDVIDKQVEVVNE